MKRFIFTENSHYPKSSSLVKEAVALAESILQSDEFYESIASKSEYDMADISPKELADTIKDFDEPANIKVRKLGLLAYGTTMGDTFTINVRKLVTWRGIPKRSIPSLVGTIIHEYIHVVDNNVEASFGHGNNKPTGKENTAPYYIGRRGVEFANLKIGNSSDDVIELIVASSLASTDIVNLEKDLA